MSITVNVVGQTNIVTSITNSDGVDVSIGTMAAQTLTSLAIIGGSNVTVTTTSGVFTIIGRDVPVDSVNGQTGTVLLTSSSVSAASAVHTHVVTDITDFAAEAAKYGPVSSVNGQTGTVSLTSADVSAASAAHSHTAGNITDFASEAAKFGPVSSVNGQTGTVSLTSAGVSAASAVHTHVVTDITDFAAEAAKYGPVSSVNGQTGTVSLAASDVSAASAVHTHVATDVTDFSTEAAKYGPVSSVNGQTGTVNLVASDVSAASATHAHSYVLSLNGQTGTLSIAAGDNVTVSTSEGSITIAAAAGGTSGGSVTSVNGQTGAITLVATDVSAEKRLTWGVVSIDNTSATLEHNVDFGTATVIRVTPITEGNFGATGAANGSEGAHYRLINATTILDPSLAFTIVYESTASFATNRFHTVDGLDRVLGPSEQAEIMYDPYINRWRVTPCCGGGY